MYSVFCLILCNSDYVLRIGTTKLIDANQDRDALNDSERFF